MNGSPTGFNAVIGTLGATAPVRMRTRFLMLDSSDGAARLVFESADGRQAGTVERWLAIVRRGARADGSSATWVVWLLDGSTAVWAAGRPPAGLRRGTTGLGDEAHPVLWFHARVGRRARRPVRGRSLAAAFRLARRPWGFTVAGVFGAAGIVDGAHLRVSRRPAGRRTRLRMSIDSQVWELSPAWPDADGDSAPFRLAITADGAARPLELAVVRQWL